MACNVRELQNVIERSVVVSMGEVLSLRARGAQANRRLAWNSNLGRSGTRAHPAGVAELRLVLGGPSGAAVRLGVKRTTLLYKMRRLGIDRPADQTFAARAHSGNSASKI